jgi:heme exporter protein CcmD
MSHEFYVWSAYALALAMLGGEVLLLIRRRKGKRRP